MTDSRIAAVIFDMDGVLIDSSDAHFESWRLLATDLGTQITEDEFRATFGRQNRDVIPQLFGTSLTPERIEELSETKERYYRELVSDAVHAIDGATDLVKACHASGLRCAIGSSGHPVNIRITLEAMGISALFAGVVSGKDVKVGKPDPQVFQLASDRMGVSAERCVVIEDAPAGIDAALAAGMTAIGVTTQHPRDRLEHAHLVVDRIDELSPDRIRKAGE